MTNGYLSLIFFQEPLRGSVSAFLFIANPTKICVLFHSAASRPLAYLTWVAFFAQSVGGAQTDFFCRICFLSLGGTLLLFYPL
jgi:hypothetical protein